jgi:hypothetical protein
VTSKKPASDDRAVAQPPAAVPPSTQGPASDVALIHGVTPDGQGLQIVRARENRLELGAIRPLREGAPITGEIVTLRPRADFPALCDVEVQFKPPTQPLHDRQEVPALAAHSGPAQVATDDYRRNWDAIWSSRAPSNKLVN